MSVACACFSACSADGSVSSRSWRRRASACADDALGLDDGSPRLAIVEHDQRVAGLDRLTFGYGHIRHDAGDLAADVDPEWRFDMAARHDRLDEVGADDRIGTHHGTEQERRAEVAS